MEVKNRWTMTKKKIELLVSDSDNNELLKQPSLAEN